MRSSSTRLYPLPALATALVCAIGFVVVWGVDETTKLTKPSSVVEIGIGAVSDDNQRFGQYTGLNEDGAYGLLDLSVVRRDEATGTWSITSP